MTIEQRITNMQHSLPRLMEEALMKGIAIGYEATMAAMAERYDIERETEETEDRTETEQNDFELVLK